MKSRLVDPVQFFDAMGRSCLSYDLLEARVKKLEAENEKLRRIAVHFKDLSGWQPTPIAPVLH
jgi:hypothetical protein